MLKKVLVVITFAVSSLSFGQENFKAKLKNTLGEGFALWTPGTVELKDDVLTITNKLVPNMNVNVKITSSTDKGDIYEMFSGENYRIRLYKTLNLIEIDSKDEWKDKVTTIKYVIKVKK
jgi:hypothetical protein